MIRIARYLLEHKLAVLVILLFLIIQASCEIVLPQYTAEIVDIGVQNGDMDFLKISCLKMIAFSVMMMAAAGAASFVAAKTGAAIGRDLRGRVFRKVISFSGAEIDSFSTASLITRCTNDVQQITMVCILLLRMVLYAPVIGTAGIVMVMTTNTGMSWIIALAVGAIVMLVLTLMGLAIPKFRIMQKLIDRMNLVSREILTGISVIRAFNRQNEEERRFDEVNTELMKTQLFTNRVLTFMMPSMLLLMNAVSVLVVWAGSRGVDAGMLQVGDMIAFITYAVMIVMAFMMITMIAIFLPRAGVAAGRIDEVLNMEPSIANPEVSELEEGHCFTGEICFDDVCFRYPGADEDVISNVSFTAEAHKTTAIIGSTGSGKSTIVKLVPRFYDVTGGSVSIDGTDVRNMNQETLRSAIGYVPQQGVLFSGTIESNIKYAGKHISDEAMRMAAETAQAADFINAKQDGYEAAVSQNGSNVSGGQRQRLSIARAIAKKPAIFLFDDSFSALDLKTDAALRHALAKTTDGATVLIVAQRISSIMDADRIIVLDEGRVVGTGTHAELMKNCAEYREIAESQLSQYELEGGAR